MEYFDSLDCILPVGRMELVIRILAMKATMGLPEKKREGTIVPGEEVLSIVGCDEHKAWTRECANEAMTLVKDIQNLLPISLINIKRSVFIC